MPVTVTDSGLSNFMRRAGVAAVLLGGGVLLLTTGIYGVFGDRPLQQVETPYLLAKEANWRADPEATAVFVGSSVTFQQIDPQVFDATVGGGMRSYNLGNPGFFPLRSISYLEHLLSTAPPTLDLVVMELFRLDEIVVNYRSIETMRITNVRSWLFALRSIAAANYPRRYKLRLAGQYTRALAYKSFGFGMVSYLTQQRELRPLDHERLMRAPRGFLAKDTELAGTLIEANAVELRTVRSYLEGKPRLIDGRRELHRAKYRRAWRTAGSPYIEHLRQLVTMAESRDIHLVFLLPPLLTERDVYFAYPAFLALPEHNRIDLSDPDRFPEFYDYEHMYDLEHLNSSGATKFSRQLGLAYTGLRSQREAGARDNSAGTVRAEAVWD